VCDGATGQRAAASEIGFKTGCNTHPRVLKIVNILFMHDDLYGFFFCLGGIEGRAKLSIKNLFMLIASREIGSIWVRRRESATDKSISHTEVHTREHFYGHEKKSAIKSSAVVKKFKAHFLSLFSSASSLHGTHRVADCCCCCKKRQYRSGFCWPAFR
jgi:hypothetical protein